MSAEIICIGTELLLGEILNANAQYLAQQLADLGIPHYYQSVVGDNIPRIHQVLTVACARSQLLIFTGGLGPTPDDLTTEAIAQFFQTPLEENAEVLADITEKFARRGRPMAPSNRKQALIPAGANVLPNPRGSAPGMIWQPRPNVTILTFPGVPKEMHAMWQETAVPFLRSQGWGKTTIYSQVLRFWGIPESTLAEKVSPLLNLENPTVAPYAGNGEVRLRISAKAATESAALDLITPVAQQIRDIAGDNYFGQDDDTLASVTGNLLKAAQQTVSVAESCTGGGLGQLWTTVPGSSAYFWGGVISYDNQVKVNLLGVNPEDLQREGAVSDGVAQQMAVGVRDRLNTTWGLSITGVAGPDGGTEAKPVGLVYIGVAGPDTVESFRFLFGVFQEREFIRWLSACSAIDLLRRKLIAQ
ncbi:MAG: competence/damage-inducible protein A [Oculatellaceae cyanobacterium Prado106]|jgi:nicotinamide-nucleotide amidase|nr:competence/damage-inducible protein A [Oculatellaceae cyanobacterium Prado106]